MSDIKLFNIKDDIKELAGSYVLLERELQTLIENNCPVIFEYKRTSNENVINQGLFYLDWLLDYKAEFELLVMRILGKGLSEKIDWSMPRLICVAGDFTKYDEYAVK